MAKEPRPLRLLGEVESEDDLIHLELPLASLRVNDQGDIVGGEIQLPSPEEVIEQSLTQIEGKARRMLRSKRGKRSKPRRAEVGAAQLLMGRVEWIRANWERSPQGALVCALHTLAQVSFEDVLRGMRNLDQAREAAEAPKYRRGIQAWVDRERAENPNISAKMLWRSLPEGDGIEINDYVIYREGEHLYEQRLDGIGPDKRITFPTFKSYVARSRKGSSH